MVPCVYFSGDSYAWLPKLSTAQAIYYLDIFLALNYNKISRSNCHLSIYLQSLQNFHDDVIKWKKFPHYRQMGELWTLFEFACLQYLTHNMVAEMDRNISWVLFCSTIFSKLNLNGMKFGKIKRKNIAGQSYPSSWGNFGHPGETLDSRLLCTNNDLEWLPSMWFMLNNMPMITVDHK